MLAATSTMESQHEKMARCVHLSIDSIQHTQRECYTLCEKIVLEIIIVLRTDAEKKQTNENSTFLGVCIYDVRV